MSGLRAHLAGGRVLLWLGAEPGQAARLLGTRRLTGAPTLWLSLDGLIAHAPAPRVLAVWAEGRGLARVLRQAVPDGFDATTYGTKAAWRLATRYAPCTLLRRPDGRGGTTAALSLRRAACDALGAVSVDDVTDRLGGPGARPGGPLVSLDGLLAEGS